MWNEQYDAHVFTFYAFVHIFRSGDQVRLKQIPDTFNTEGLWFYSPVTWIACTAPPALTVVTGKLLHFPFIFIELLCFLSVWSQGRVECWDPRDRNRVGVLDCALNSLTEGTQYVTGNHTIAAHRRQIEQSLVYCVSYIVRHSSNNLGYDRLLNWRAFNVSAHHPSTLQDVV